MSNTSIPRLTPDTLRRIRLLRNNAIDLDVALDDITREIEASWRTATSDDELTHLFDQRDRLSALLADAKVELAALLDGMRA